MDPTPRPSTKGGQSRPKKQKIRSVVDLETGGLCEEESDEEEPLDQVAPPADRAL